MKLLISGGGSGGHLIPGIALYEEFASRGNVELKYVLREQDMKYTVAGRIIEADRMFVNIQGVSRKLSLKTPVYILKLLGAFRQVFRSIKIWNPDAVLITGGYVANPVALSARFLRKPLFIVEPNSVAGATCRMYAPRAKAVFTVFPQTLKLRAREIIRTGNPSIFKDASPRKDACKYFGLDAGSPIVAVLGGSQGAKAINNSLAAALPEFAKRGWQVIWGVGAVDFDRLEKDGTLARVTKEFPGVKPYRFIDRMDSLFSACDVVVNRSGVTTITEMIHFGTPSVLIPIKNSPDNHQYLNAKFVSDAGGAVMLQEDDLTPESFVASVETAMKDSKRMRESLLAMKPESPAKRIADEVMKRAGK